MRKCLIALAALVVFGCSDVKYLGFNSQLAALNGAGQITSAEIYDNVDYEKVADIQILVMDIVNESRHFINTGQIGTWTLNELESYLFKKFDEKYHWIIIRIVNALGAVTLPTDKISDDVKARIFEVLDGVELRTGKYDLTRHSAKKDSNDKVYKYEAKSVKVKQEGSK